MQPTNEAQLRATHSAILNGQSTKADKARALFAAGVTQKARISELLGGYSVGAIANALAVKESAVSAAKQAPLQRFGHSGKTKQRAAVIQPISTSLRQPVRGEPATYSLIGYHATPLDNLASILKNGLVPGFKPPSGQDWTGTWSGKGIYFHQTFPSHELYNSYDEKTGDPFSLVLECHFTAPAQCIVPDEDATKDLSKTRQVIKFKDAIAVGIVIPASTILCVHLIKTKAAQEWASKHLPKKIDCRFHYPPRKQTK